MGGGVGSGLGRDLVGLGGVDVDLVLGVVLLAFLEAIGAGDREFGAVAIEGEGGDARRELGELAEALLVGAVPEVDEAVGAAGRERAVGRVERERVDRIDDLADLPLFDIYTARRDAFGERGVA